MKKLHLVVGEKMQAIIDKFNNGEWRSKVIYGEFWWAVLSDYDTYLKASLLIGIYNYVIDNIGRDIELRDAMIEFTNGIEPEVMLNKYYVLFDYESESDPDDHSSVTRCYDEYNVGMYKVRTSLDVAANKTAKKIVNEFVYYGDVYRYSVMKLNNKKINKAILLLRDSIKSTISNIDCELVME
jgi:hypothetical protein